ncbi:MAG: hypothetical protein VZQ83_07035 [Eubacterium sp.]|nr:hypothetical protein [Eubacterium sp.]
MKSDVISIDNQGNGLDAAKKETERVAEYQGLDTKQTLHLQLCAEEMLCLARSVTGEMKAEFWIECEDKHFDLHMTTKTVLDKAKRETLIAASTSRKNEATGTFLGRLRNAFEEAMLDETDTYTYIPNEAMADMANRMIDDTDWDQYEQSVLRKVADQIKISVVGRKVDMTIVKNYD